MRLKDNEVRTKLLKRTLLEFLTNLKEQEITDFYDWIISIVQDNNGVRYDNIQKVNEVTEMYTEFIEETTGVIDKEYNKKRKVLRMIEGTRINTEKVLEQWGYFEAQGVELNKKQMNMIIGYLYCIFYYDTAEIENIRTRYQNLAFVLMVVNESTQEELEKMVLHCIEHGGTVLNTVFEGRKGNDTNR